jgi:hypothetical protein
MKRTRMTIRILPRLLLAVPRVRSLKARQRLVVVGSCRRARPAPRKRTRDPEFEGSPGLSRELLIYLSIPVGIAEYVVVISVPAFFVLPSG